MSRDIDRIRALEVHRVELVEGGRSVLLLCMYRQSGRNNRVGDTASLCSKHKVNREGLPWERLLWRRPAELLLLTG